ncbi:MAG TPA: hypothetical protein VEC18_01805, partial [Myxococcota bacterium]|nr:hypothetical protein [Myxococcota bacterium]
AQLDGRHETVYVDRGLGDLRVFYYRVTAVNAADGVGIPTEPVRAVTKPEPLPPIGLHRASQQLGANQLAWERNVEEDIAGYRVFRIRQADEAPEQIASVGPDETTATDSAVAAAERVSYTLTAVDRDGLESEFADAIEVESEHYALSATARSDGVHLEWSDRSGEGFRGAHVFRTALLQNKNLGFSTEPRFVDRDVREGATYRYTVVFERADQSLAPRSEAVEIAIPKRAAD